MKEHYYRNFKLYNQNITDDNVETYYSPCDGLLIVILKNGRRMAYYESECTTRYLPPDDKELTEEQCMYEFGDRLRLIMMSKGINQLELSERTGISQPALSNYLNGRACPNLYRVDKIAKALGCTLDDLTYRI